MQAFTKGNGKEMSPKAHLNSDLNENQDWDKYLGD